MRQSVTLTVRPGRIFRSSGGQATFLYWRRHRERQAVARYQIEEYVGGPVPTRPYRVTYRLNARGKRIVGYNRYVFCFWPKGWTESTRYSRKVEVI